MLLKLASCGQIVDIQSYLTVADNISPPEQSNVIYYKVLHQRCDDKETLLNVINDIYAEFVATGKRNLIFLEGDQATYERLQSIKREYLRFFMDDTLPRGLAYAKKLPGSAAKNLL